MALRAAAYCLLVQPTGDNNETEKGRLIVVQNDQPQRNIYCGVILHVGSRVEENCEEGNLAHYTNYHEIGDLHVVPIGHLIAIEDDDE